MPQSPVATLADDAILTALSEKRFGVLERFTQDETKSFLKQHAREGLLCVVVSTYGGMTECYLDVVVGVNPRGTRFYTSTYAAHKASPSARAAWYFTGQSADAPTGQTRLYPPVPELVDAALARRMLAMWGRPTSLKGRQSYGADSREDLIAAAVAQTRRLFSVELDPARYRED